MSLRAALGRVSALSTRTRVPTPRAGGEHFYEPSGYLFNEKPLAAGQKRVKDWWEDLYLIFMGGGMAFAAIGLYFKPDTNVQTWARKEAERRLAESGLFQEDE
ncbi:hypothetical protein GGF32_008180 [Allomyces javanicus]|nr:hypothetical protein GGF32_008180 [Allomyces javanicus]